MTHSDLLKTEAREAFEESVDVLTDDSSSALKTQAVDDALAAVAAYVIQLHIEANP